MSTYTASTSSYRASLLTAVRALMPQCQAQAQALCQGFGSTELHLMASQLAVLAPPASSAELATLWRDVEQVLEPRESMLAPATANLLESLGAQVGELVARRQPLNIGVVNATVDQLTVGLQQATADIAGYERAITAQAAGLALADLGYAVTRVDGASVTGFEASRGHEKLLVEVAQGGRIVTDHIGLSEATSCGQAQAAFVDQLATHGVQVVAAERHDHRDPRGGGLAIRAAKVRGATMAERIVKSYNPPERSRRGSDRRRTMMAEQVQR